MVVEDDRRKLYELQVEGLRKAVAGFKPRNITYKINNLDRCFEYDQLKKRGGSDSSIFVNISEKPIAHALENALSDYFASISKYCEDCKLVTGKVVSAKFEKKCSQSARICGVHSKNCSLPDMAEMTWDNHLKTIMRQVI